jgi:hypothetical protein
LVLTLKTPALSKRTVVETLLLKYTRAKQARLCIRKFKCFLHFELTEQSKR